jgi:putative transcriptional regulator
MQYMWYNMTNIYDIVLCIFGISVLSKRMTDLSRKNRVKLARVENDLTQAQLAERAGVTRQTIGLIEAGRFNPSLKLCIAIAKALNKTLDDLFWIEEEDEHG